MLAWFEMKLFVFNYCYNFYFYNLIRVTDEVANETEKNLSDEKPAVEDVADGNKESSANENEEKEPEDKVTAQSIYSFYKLNLNCCCILKVFCILMINIPTVDVSYVQLILLLTPAWIICLVHLCKLFGLIYFFVFYYYLIFPICSFRI